MLISRLMVSDLLSSSSFSSGAMNFLSNVRLGGDFTRVERSGESESWFLSSFSPNDDLLAYFIKFDILE